MVFEMKCSVYLIQYTLTNSFFDYLVYIKIFRSTFVPLLVYKSIFNATPIQLNILYTLCTDYLKFFLTYWYFVRNSCSSHPNLLIITRLFNLLGILDSCRETYYLIQILNVIIGIFSTNLSI